jgi:hypothetical protein
MREAADWGRRRGDRDWGRSGCGRLEAGTDFTDLGFHLLRPRTQEKEGLRRQAPTAGFVLLTRTRLGQSSVTHPNKRQVKKEITVSDGCGEKWEVNFTVRTELDGPD